MDNHADDNATLKKRCLEVKKLCTKTLEKSDFLRFVNSDGAHAVRSEILSINAEINMAEIILNKADLHEAAEESFLGLISSQNRELSELVERCSRYFGAALKSTVPDTRSSHLENILCQSLYLSPSTILFNNAIEELQVLRRTLSEGLKRALRGERLLVGSERSNNIGMTLTGSPAAVPELSRADALSKPETWEDWLHAVLKTTDADIAKLLRLQSQLFALLWLQIPHFISGFSSDAPTGLVEATDQLDTKLRDTLVRRFSSKYTMVFVGVQSSGKSMFLNAFLGKTLLPSHGSATTTYPCRIRHVTGKTVPELHLSKSLDHGISCLREFNWLDKYQRYVSYPQTWTGNGLPLNVKASNLVATWEAVRKVTRDNYARFMEPSFSIPRIVYGEEEITEWLQRINDLSMLCRYLYLPFEGFLFEDWALILCEFSVPPLAPVNGFCEVIDIPGIDDLHSWDEVIQEVIRQANAIVAVVSLQDFETSSWAPTAALLSGATSLPVTAIVLTKADTELAKPGVPELPINVVKGGFWKSGAARGPVLRCSIIGGNGAKAILELVSTGGTKPSFESLQVMPYAGYFGRSNAIGAKRLYNGLNIEELKKDCKAMIEAMAVDDTFEKLYGIMNDGLGRQLSSEMVGIDKELESLQSLIISRGKGPQAISPKPSTRLPSLDSGEILRIWSQLQKNAHDEIEALISASSSLATNESRSSAMNAIDSAMEEIMHSTDSDQTIEFDDFQALEIFVTTVQRAFSTLQSAASEKILQNMLREGRISIKQAVTSMQEGIEALRSYPYKLVQPQSQTDPVIDLPPVPDLLETGDGVKKERRLVRGFCAFYEWRRQIQRRLSANLPFPATSEELSGLQRWFIAAIAAATFPIRDIVGIYQTLFILDLDKLQKSLEDIGEEQWEATFTSAFRREIRCESDPVWDAAHLAIMMAMAGVTGDAEEKKVIVGETLSAAALQESPRQVNIMIAAHLGSHALLASKLQKVLPPPKPSYL